METRVMQHMRVVAHAALERAADIARPQVGYMTDNRSFILRDCGGHRADVIVTLLNTLVSTCDTNPRLSSLRRAVLQDGTVDVWMNNPKQRSSEILFRFQVGAGLDPNDLVLVMSLYVPFGVPGDPSHYPVEVSTEYRRPSQRIQPVLSLELSRSARDDTESRSSSETSSGTSEYEERAERSGWQATNSQSELRAHKFSKGTESTRSLHSFVDNRNGTFDTTHESDEYSRDARQEQSNSRSADLAKVRRQDSGATQAKTEASSRYGSMAASMTVSFAAVGTDYTDGEKLWRAWSARPEHSEAVLMAEVIRTSANSLATLLSESIRTLKLKSRREPCSVLGEHLSDRFWTTVKSLALVDPVPDLMTPRNALPAGTPGPIPEDLARRALTPAQQRLAEKPPRTKYLGGW